MIIFSQPKKVGFAYKFGGNPLIRSTLKKITASLLALVFVFSLFACKAKPKLPEAAGIDTLPAETPIVKINDYVVTWDLYYYFLNYITSSMLNYMSYYGMDATDWSVPEEFEGSGKSYYEYAVENAYAGLKWYIAIYLKADEAGVEWTDELQAQLEAEYDQMTVSYGTEEAAIEAMAEQGLVKSSLLWLLKAEILNGEVLEKIYGEDCKNYPDDKAEKFITENDYFRAQHILLMTTDDAGVDFDDDKKAVILEQINAIVDDLNAYDGDDFGAYFSELMKEKSEDPGSTTFPDGYVFTDGDMVTEFFDEAKVLEVGAFSKEPVKTSYGYHILYKLALSPDDSYTNNSSGVTKTLRAFAAEAELNVELNAKTEAMQITELEGLSKFNFEDVFVKPLLAEPEPSGTTEITN
jgi:parvulin-like peptidyl-prolyl isomerase